MYFGAPCGMKNFRKCRPWIMKPSTVAPTITHSAMAKLTMMCAVKVKLPGISPRRLPSRMKMKRVKMMGK